jgi:hypothetical protein
VIYFQRRKLGPGSYDINVGGFSGKAVGERASGPGNVVSWDSRREWHTLSPYFTRLIMMDKGKLNTIL